MEVASKTPYVSISIRSKRTYIQGDNYFCADVSEIGITNALWRIWGEKPNEKIKKIYITLSVQMKQNIFLENFATISIYK